MTLPGIKQRIARALTPHKRRLEAVAQLEARIAARWASAAHRRLFTVQWALPPQPEHFDHDINLYYSYRESRDPMWLERGIFGALALKGGDALELACGDGFNARNCYSLRSRRVVACDFDPAALAIARRKNPAPNVEYLQADIRTAMPRGTFDNVLWDGAIEHFTPAEIAEIMRAIKSRLAPGGVLSGYTIAARQDSHQQLSHHEYEFADKADLLRFFTPHFANAVVFETFSPDRHNLYFYASDGPLPLDPDWARAVRHVELPVAVA
jgi:SAM-dependent methyltransferase